MPFPKKAPHEEKLLTFDFSTEAATGSTLSNAAVTATVLSGADDESDLTIGTPNISDQSVEVLVGGGLEGAKYRLSCEVDADNGEHHQIDRDLPVSVKGALIP